MLERLRRRGQRRAFSRDTFNFGGSFGGRCFFVDDPAAGGGAGGGTNPADKKDPAPSPEMIPKSEAAKAFQVPKSEAAKAFQARDAAKAEARVLASAFGLDPDAVKVVKTDDPENPYKLEGEGVEEALAAVNNARQGRQKATKWEDREREITKTYTTKLQTAAQTHQRERAELENLIRSELTIPALRAAFAQEGAIDGDGKGTYGDLIKLTRDRVKVDITADDAGKFRVSVTPLNEDGTPLLDGKTQEPVGLRQLAATFLSERPHLRSANFRRGPGAGGRGAGAGSAGQQGQQPQVGGAAAAQYLFGKPR